MKNDLLTQALKSSLESIDGHAEMVPAENIEEVFQELGAGSSDIDVDQVAQDENEVSQAVDQIEVLRSMVIASPEGVASLEGLNRMIDLIGMRYGQVEVTSLENMSADSAKENLTQRLDHIQASLESALTVSQESWSVKDLWDRAGGVERNSNELVSALKQLESKKNWFSENGIIINSLGQLKFLTVNEQFTKGLVKDTDITVAHVSNMLKIAEDSTTAAQKISALVKSARIVEEKDALDLLNKVVGIKNPSSEAKQKLDNEFILNNEHATFMVSPVKNSTGFDLKGWENIGSYERTTLGKAKHGTKASTLLRVPAWILGYTFGGGVAGAAIRGVVGAGGVANLGTLVAAVMIGFAASGALNDRKHSKQLKHSIKYSDIKSTFDAVTGLARKTSATRRMLPGAFSKAVAGRDDTLKQIDGAIVTSSGQGKEALKLIRKIYTSVDRLGWSLNQNAFGIMETLTSNCNTIARKMVNAAH